MRTEIPNPRAGRAEPLAAASGQWFGQLSSTGQPAALYTTLAALIERHACDACERLWLVNSRTIDVVRYSQVALSPLEPNTILGTGQSRQRSPLRLRISCDGPRGPDSFDVDCDQPLYVWAADVTVTLLGPRGLAEVGGSTTPSASGLVVDTLAGLEIAAVNNTAGPNLPLYSQTVYVEPSESDTAIPVPPHATKLTAYMTDAGTYPPTTRFFLGDPVTYGEAPGAIDLGGIAWDTAGQRRPRHEILVPAHATHLVISREQPLGQAGRVFTFVWEISP